MLYQNVRGLRTKTSDIYSSIASENFDIILLTETWLCSDIDSSDLFDNRYIIFRKDRNSATSSFKRGGGVVIAVKNCFEAFLIDVPDLELECLWISLNLRCRGKLLLCLIYFPPNTNIDTYVKFFDVFVRFTSYKNIFVCGDFNLSIIGELCRDNILDPTIRELFNFVQLYNLNQFNAVPNCNNKYLDLILSDIDVSNINVKRSDRPLVFEDKYHPALCIVIGLIPTRASNHGAKFPKYDFKKADFLTMWYLISEIDWNFLNTYDNVNLAVGDFYRYLIDVFNHTIPVKTFNKKFPFWYSTETIKLIKYKNKVRKLALHNGNPIVLEEFKYLRSSVKLNISRDYTSYLQTTENNLISNPKKFWSYFNKHNLLPNTIYYNNISYDGDDEIANVFASYFSSVYASSTDYDSNTAVLDCCLSDIIKIENITYMDVVLAIKKLKSSLTVGVDNVPSFIVKGCSDAFIYPLLILFNLSLKTSVFPDVWKQTKIIPVFKKGDANDCKNYRPIAILSPFSKIFEIIIHNKIFQQVKHLISSAQHGFIPKRSTLTNLFCLTNNIMSSFEYGYQLDVIYTDFSKAFDSIDFGILLNKLIGMGFHINLIVWLFSYLKNRMLYVYFNGAVSYKFTNTSGVPQGSNLGPLLFILFINDLCSILEFSDYLLFADDLKLFRQVRSVADAALLQSDLNGLFNWCICNKLFLNINKCNVLSYSRRTDTLVYPYQINNLALCRPSTIVDLGITFDTKLDFSLHIDNIVSKAYKKLGFLKRKTKDFSSQQALKVLYFALVRSNLEYCSLIWDPYYNNKIKVLERVQSKFTRYLLFQSNQVYSYDISSSYLRSIFNIPNLKSRRDLFCVLFFYKVINNMIDCTDILNSIDFNVPNRSLRCTQFFKLPFLKYNYVDNFSLYKFYRIFNEFSAHLDIFNMSFSAFRDRCSELLIS